MRAIVLVVVACGSSAKPGPIANTKRDSLDEAVKRQRLALYEPATIAKLDAKFDPRTLHEVEAFIIDIGRDDDTGWKGTIGVVPLAGCCLEPVAVFEPTVDPKGVWTINAHESTFWGCGSDVTTLVLVPKPDGTYDTTCGEKRVVLAHGKPIDARKAEWERARIDELFAVVKDKRLVRAGKQWRFDGNELKRCAVLARECSLEKLVGSCSVDESRVVRVRDGKLEIVKGETPFTGAATCVKGVLPGVD